MDTEEAQREYFTSYDDLEIHKLMLEDNARTETYKKAILSNKTYFKNKIVMDVGCGTGILSLFCAQAGAKKVYAVEASNIADIAKSIVKENNLENIIEVIHGKVEDIVLPNNIKVDAIVSEWMGFYLLHEGMLDSVLVARDKFLKENGEMFPESAAIYIAPCRVPSLYDKWSNFHGVSLTNFAKHLRMGKCNKPEIISIRKEDLIGDEVALCWINLRDDNVLDLESFSIQHVVGASQAGMYQGLCMWFECNFPDLTKENERIVLNTGPGSPPTHWKQTIILLPDEQSIVENEPIAFQLDMTRDKLNTRRYNLQFTMLDPDSVEHPLPCACYMTKCILIKTFMSQQAEQSIGEMKFGDNTTNILEEEDVDKD